MSELEHRVETLEGHQKSLETAFSGIIKLLEDNNKKLDATAIMTDKMYTALTTHTKQDETWRGEIKEFMTKIYKCIWGNGVPGLKTQIFVLWLGGGLIATGTIYLFFMHLK